MNPSSFSAGSRYGSAYPPAISSAQSRLSFIRKTYALFFSGILSATAGAMAALYVGEPVRVGALAVPPAVAWVASSPLLTLLVYFGAFFGLQAARQVRGLNVAALVGFTFLSGLFLAPALFIANLNAAAGHSLSAHPVRDAFVLASTGFGGLTAYVFVTKKDFSFLGGMLSMGLWVLLGAMLLGMFVGGQVFQLAIASVGVLLFGAYVLYNTSQLLRDDQVGSPIDAAIALYLNFLNLFVFLLQILSSGRRSS